MEPTAKYMASFNKSICRVYCKLYLFFEFVKFYKPVDKIVAE